MTVSVLDLFKIGVGPSSSHTVGPMSAANRFIRSFAPVQLDSVESVTVELFGSLGATGRGHGSVAAIVLGLMGREAGTLDPSLTPGIMREVEKTRKIALLGEHNIAFSVEDDLVLHRRKRLGYHSNAMTFVARDASGSVVAENRYYSVGGGFVVDEDEAASLAEPSAEIDPMPFTTAGELLERANSAGIRISDVILENEKAHRSEAELISGLMTVWQAMRSCVQNGLEHEGDLPGALRVRRRAKRVHDDLVSLSGAIEPLDVMDWVTVYALAVNEENAAGGRVVTAPTNGAAGIIPAVLHYYSNFVPGADDDGVARFLLVAGGIGMLFKRNASISGAEVGCQGEVGSACAMAAAGLAELLGGTPEQVENAAEIGLEHNLGLTCDPVGGLVQIPCIERNAVAAVKAIAAARMALRGDGVHHVSLDMAIKTMRDTGADMKDKYKETSRGGLALNVVEC